MQSTSSSSFSSSSSSPSYSALHTKALSLEKQILSLSGLTPGIDIEIFDIPINFAGCNYIHTYCCGTNNEKPLVLLHGYAGSSVLFYPVLKELSNHFKVYCLDLLGMGLSSRPDFHCESTGETIEYFVESLEKWREAIGFEKFYLGGHALGAYIASNYALKHQQRVNKLLLVSPIGITMEQDEEELMQWVNSMSWAKKKMYEMYIKLWESKATPSEFMKTHPILGKFFIKKYFQKQFGEGGATQEFVKLLYKLFKVMLKLPPGSERALHCLLGPPIAIVYAPLEHKMLEELIIPTFFFYGENDRGDCNGACRLTENEEKKNFMISYVKGAGNQVFIDSPEEIISQFIDVINS